MRHRLGLATRTQISVCKLPFPSAGTALNALNALKKVGKVVEAKEAKTAYNEAKRVDKSVVWLAKSEDERGIFADISPTGDGVFWLAKQMDRTNQDVVREKCVQNDAGELSLSDEDKMKA